MSTDRLLRLNQIVPHLLPISKTSWWNGVKKGIYPKSVKLGPRTTAWRESEILAIIEKERAK
jgi:prophage regulatory protein